MPYFVPIEITDGFLVTLLIFGLIGLTFVVLSKLNDRKYK